MVPPSDPPFDAAWANALAKTVAHESQHNNDNLENMPVWLREGRAEFAAFHALNTRTGLPTVEGSNFLNYRINLNRNVTTIVNRFYGGKFPSLSYIEEKNVDAPTQTNFGEFFLDGLLELIGPQNMSGFFKEIGQTAQQKFIDEAVFRTAALKHTPQNLQPQMNRLLQDWYHRDSPAFSVAAPASKAYAPTPQSAPTAALMQIVNLAVAEATKTLA